MTEFSNWSSLHDLYRDFPCISLLTQTMPSISFSWFDHPNHFTLPPQHWKSTWSHDTPSSNRCRGPLQAPHTRLEGTSYLPPLQTLWHSHTIWNTRPDGDYSLSSALGVVGCTALLQRSIAANKLPKKNLSEKLRFCSILVSVPNLRICPM
jgi:hypothetical protein